MKKLRNKIFLTIFSILSLFILIVICFVNIQNYNKEKHMIENIFMRSSKPKIIPSQNNSTDMKQPEDKSPKDIFIELDVYTVTLDEDGKYSSSIDHRSSNTDINIEKIAGEIINNHSSDKKIGNLFTNKYSYYFSGDKLIIIDNRTTNLELKLYLIYSIIMFILLEFIVSLISYLLTSWISEPVELSFEKQKQFIADASHELKTPIAVIMASAEDYSNDNNLKWINNIKSESERMNKLVTDLLDLAKSEKNDEIVKNEENISKIIEGSVLTFESLFYEKNIKLKYDIVENLKYNCNSDDIKELMSILIDNAIKHSAMKGKVIIKLYKNNKNIVLEVSNKGEAIKEEDRQKIFERFYKSDVSRNRNNNTYGLGLAIAKNIVTLHGGTIEAYSDGGFTTFKVIL